MKQHLVKIKSVHQIPHDVLQIVTEKPQKYSFNPGQATEIAINKTRWKNEKRSFYVTSLPESGNLEFTIKMYPSHNGVTNELLHLGNGDELILHNVFGAIDYKGEGVLIAGGAGITPFISIFRYLQAKSEAGNKLIFANKTNEDIILALEFKKILDEDYINILSGEITDEYANGRINEYFLKSNKAGFSQQFYICGPPPMMDAILKQLAA